MLARGDGRLLAMFRIPDIQAGDHTNTHMLRGYVQLTRQTHHIAVGCGGGIRLTARVLWEWAKCALSSFGPLPVPEPLLRS